MKRNNLPVAPEAPKWPHPSFAKEQRVEVKTTIVINKPGTYDYSGKLHIWVGEDGGCEQKENGPQILRVEANNVVVKNFHFRGDKQDGSHGLGDPVHIATCGNGQGYKCTTPGPTNVVIDGMIGHACEDLLTVGTPGASDIVIKNSVFYANPNPNCRDKTLQFSFGKGLRIENNIFVGGERTIRLNPNTYMEVVGNTFYGVSFPVRLTVLEVHFPPVQKQGPSAVTVSNNNFIGCKGALFTDHPTGKITQSGNKFTSCPLWTEGSVGGDGGKGKPTGGKTGGKTGGPTGKTGGKTKGKTGGPTGGKKGSKKPKTGTGAGVGSGSGGAGTGGKKPKSTKSGSTSARGKKPKKTGTGTTGTGGSGAGKKPKTSGRGGSSGKQPKGQPFFGL